MKKVYILLGVLVLLVLLYVGYVAASKSGMKPKKSLGCQEGSAEEIAQCFQICTGGVCT
jgi:hypothetical protein